MAGKYRLAVLGLSLVIFSTITEYVTAAQPAGSTLQMYVDALPQLPRLAGFSTSEQGVSKPGRLTIGMFQKKWKFHRDLPASTVFVYGTSADAATFPGPLIEARQGTPLYVTWENYLPQTHILPWDPTVPTAIPKSGGVPAVVHLHGGIHEPQSDGSALAWFTANYTEKGSAWSKATYLYPNVQHPGNLWYHDHALGLTRVNLLAGLLGPYVVRNPQVEGPFMLPSGDVYDRHLVIADRSFNTDGSIYMSRTGNNPSIHPQWQPEYFGDAVTVNGKAWPFLKVRRRKYRFRIINASNARYLRLALTGGPGITVVGSDTSYLPAPVATPALLVAPAEIFDVVVDFSTATADESEMTNDAPYPYPTGTAAALPSSRVMKFVISRRAPSYPADNSRVPASLVTSYPAASAADASATRYIVMYEYMSGTDHPTHLYINGKRFEDPVTETPKAGSTEVWEVINLTGDNHPLHIHLGVFQAVKVQRLVNQTDFQNCMDTYNDAMECNIAAHATGPRLTVPAHEKTWKNVVKIEPGCMTTVVVKFNLVEKNAPYPFDATAEPGYVYHCHILDHEDNAMIRPLKLVA